MENGKLMLVVDKVHPKNKHGYTVNVRIETKYANGMKTTRWASIKSDKKPKLGSKIPATRVETERNAEGYNWVTCIE